MASGVTIDFNANLARFSSQIDKAVADLNKFQSNADRMAKNVNMAFTGLKTLVPAGLFVNFVKGTIDAADNLKDMTERTGIAVDVLASLKVVAEQSGASIEEVGIGLKNLAKNVALAKGGNEEMRATLAALGVTGNDLKENFFQLANSFSKMEDGGGKLAIAQKVLGKSGEALIPTLNQGAESLRNSDKAAAGYAKAMKDLAPMADEFNDELINLRANVTGLSAEMLTGGLRAFNEISRVARDAANELGFFRGAWIALGGVGTALFTDEFADAAVKVENLNKKLAGLEETRAGLDKNASGIGFVDKWLWGDKKKLDADIASTKKQIAELIKSTEAKAAKDTKNPVVDVNAIAQAQCEATGGRWDGKKCVKAKKTNKAAAVRDPLESLLGQTEVGKVAEINKQVELLTARFEKGKIAPAQYAQALAILNGELDKIKSSKDVFGDGSFISADPAVIEMIKEQQEAINELNGEMAQDGINTAEDYKAALKSLVSDTTLAKTDELQKNIDLLNKAFFDGDIGASQYEEAIKNLTTGTAEKLDKTKTMAEELGMTFTSAFEDAVVGGKKFSDVLRGLAEDIQRIILRKTITEPLMGAIKGIDFGAILGGLVGSANGNVFTSAGLSAYSGSVVSRPTVFPFASGIGLMGEAGPEAILPLKRGANGKLGVEGGGSMVQVNVINNASGTEARTSERADNNGNRIIDVMIDQVKSAMAGDVARGGTFSSAMERTYGLSRAAGAF